MKFVVGLGNPGKKYEKTRHNVGFMVLDKLADELGVTGWAESPHFKSLIARHNQTFLIKPQTFMNRSGDAVGHIINFYKVRETEKLFVVHDDLDIKFGEYKIHLGKGPKQHNGLKSIEENIGTTGFWRVRVGVDSRTSEEDMPGDEYVLKPMDEAELTTIQNTCSLIAKDLRKYVLRK